MIITNWFSCAAGLCFAAAAGYGWYAGQDLRIVVMYAALSLVNVILGTI